MTARPICIIGSNRIPFARSFTQYFGLTNQDLMTAAIQPLVQKFGLNGERIGEVACGAVLKHSSDWNLAREVVLGSGLSAETPGYDVVQACGTSLEAAICVGNKIALGQIEVGIAGGMDTNSDLPFVMDRAFNKAMMKMGKAKTLIDRIRPFTELGLSDLKPQMPGVVEPRTHLSMGQSCEKMAQEWEISRADQDQLAYESHHKAALAYEAGFYDDLISPFNKLNKDNNLRADTTIEKLSTLKPVFDRGPKATLTAGNSTPLTDGAAAVLLASEEWAKKRNLPILAKITHVEVAAVDFVGGEGLLMAPAYAVSRLIDKAGITLQDFDFYEIHEAFAAQVLCTLKAWESEKFCRERLGRRQAMGKIDRSKMNIKGGSLAVGHPFAATGARILGGMAKILNEAGKGRGLISICTGGGMGVTAIVEK